MHKAVVIVESPTKARTLASFLGNEFVVLSSKGHVRDLPEDELGVDDLDGTIDDRTKIYTMAGYEEQRPAMTSRELMELISQAGLKPVERDTLYRAVG